MNDHDRVISGVEDANGLLSLREAVSALVAREDQRREDKKESDHLRAEVRLADGRWKTAIDDRLTRVQTDVANLRGTVDNLPTALDAKLRETSKHVESEAARVAADLVVATESTASQLKSATAALALVQKENADRRMAARSLSAGMRSAVTLLLLAAIVIVTVVVFTDQDSTTQSILILAAVSSPSLAALAFVWRKH